MTAELYDKQRDMAALTSDIDKVQEQNQALEQDFENEIERKNTNNKQVGQIISSINNIYQTCQTLTQLQKTTRGGGGGDNTVQEPSSGEDNHQMVKMLQSKLDIAVSKISELTDVLKHLNTEEFTADRYYEESAQMAADVANKRTGIAAGAAG